MKNGRFKSAVAKKGGNHEKNFNLAFDLVISGGLRFL